MNQTEQIRQLVQTLVAGTRVGVPTLLQLISVASLARMGNQFPCPPAFDEFTSVEKWKIGTVSVVVER